MSMHPLIIEVIVSHKLAIKYPIGMIMVICLCITRENGSLRPSFTGKQIHAFNDTRTFNHDWTIHHDSCKRRTTNRNDHRRVRPGAEAGNKVFVHYTGKLEDEASLTAR